MSASTSCSERAQAALAAVRRGERLPEAEVRALGEECPAEFFRIVIESLADSFEPAQAEIYQQLMRAWIPPTPSVKPVVPPRVDTAYVLSRVTLGSDIKITSAILDAMKRLFPESRIVLVGSRKSAELFAADQRIAHLEAQYPRSGPVSRRIAFADELRSRLDGAHSIVVDPDSRMTQLGLIPVCEPDRYFHFASRTLGEDADNLSDITRSWLQRTFGQTGHASIAPEAVAADGDGPKVAISLGVGDNDTKRIGRDFEARLIGLLGERYRTLWVDRGAGGEEARRVTAAVEASGAADRVRYWEGSFSGFASIVSQCDFYVGYDSGGQHAAAAAGTPLISIFAGAPSDRFRNRWSPSGPGSQIVIPADNLTADAVLERVRRWLPPTVGELDALRTKIRQAFPPVRFDGEISPCTCAECSGLQKQIWHKTWDELTPEFLDLTCSPTLFGPEAFHAFLPAFLLRALEKDANPVVAEFTIYSLCAHRKVEEIRALMTNEQIEAIRHWLSAASSLENPGRHQPAIDHACDTTWQLRSQSADPGTRL